MNDSERIKEGDKMNNQGQVSTYPEHDCHEPMQQHWHMQNGIYTYSTCGMCGKITKIEKAPELTALQKECAELRAEVERLRDPHLTKTYPDGTAETHPMSRLIAMLEAERDALKADLKYAIEQLTIQTNKILDLESLGCHCGESRRMKIELLEAQKEIERLQASDPGVCQGCYKLEGKMTAALLREAKKDEALRTLHSALFDERFKRSSFEELYALGMVALNALAIPTDKENRHE